MALKFLAALATGKVKEAARAATDALVAFDPKGATEAQISLMSEQLDQLGTKVATTTREYQDAQKALKTAQALNNQRLTAAETLQGQIAAGDTTKEQSLSTLLNIIEKAQPDLNALKKDEAEIRAYLGDLQGAYDTAADKLKTARSVLADAERGLQRAEMAKGRANARADAAALAAGVSTGGDALNTALGAMQRKTAAIQDAVVAADLRANVLQPQDHEKDDPAIAAAMASAAGEPSKPQTAAERIAALKSAA